MVTLNNRTQGLIPFLINLVLVSVNLTTITNKTFLVNPPCPSKISRATEISSLNHIMTHKDRTQVKNKKEDIKIDTK